MATRKKHTPEQIVRKLATADREPPPRTHTTWTAVAPGSVFTVLTYGPGPLYGPLLVRNFSSPGQQTSRSPRRAIGYARILSQIRLYTDQVRELSQLHSRDVTYAAFCQGLYDESSRYRRFMEWDLP